MYNNSIDPIEIFEPFVTLKSSHHYQKTTPLNIGEKNNNHIDLIDKFSPKTIKSSPQITICSSEASFLNQKNDHIDHFQPFEIINISYHHQKLDFSIFCYKQYRPQ